MASAIEGNAPVPVDGLYARHIVACIDAAATANRERREALVSSIP